MIGRTILMGLAVTTLMATVGLTPLSPQAQEVYDICQRTRLSLVETEQPCADAQDKYHMEYLCEHNSVSPHNRCWVEAL